MWQTAYNNYIAEGAEWGSDNLGSFWNAKADL